MYVRTGEVPPLMFTGRGGFSVRGVGGGEGKACVSILWVMELGNR